MEKKLFLICDAEEEFSSAFATFLSRKKDLSYTVHSCGTLEQLEEKSQQGQLGVVLLGHGFPESERRKIKADWIFVLTEDSLQNTEEGEYPVYKYQSGEEILAQIFRYMGANEKKQSLFIRGKRAKAFRLIGAFSPVHRTGQTEYAMKLGQELAMKDAVLYLSLELYGGASIDDGSETIEDVIYYARQENQNLGMLLTTMVKQKGRMDYLLPARVSENIRQVETEEWKLLLDRISKESVYDIVILDIDPGLPSPYELLRLCQEVHVLEAEDDMAKRKLAQFEEELRILGYEDVEKKLKKKVIS